MEDELKLIINGLINIKYLQVPERNRTVNLTGSLLI